MPLPSSPHDRTGTPIQDCTSTHQTQSGLGLVREDLREARVTSSSSVKIAIWEGVAARRAASPSESMIMMGGQTSVGLANPPIWGFAGSAGGGDLIHRLSRRW